MIRVQVKSGENVDEAKLKELSLKQGSFFNTHLTKISCKTAKIKYQV